MQLHTSKTSSKGFTLIELLVVIAIIGILSAIIITNLVGSKAKSRDAQRISDLNQIQLALEQYFDRCGQYPASVSISGYNGPYFPDPGTFNGCPTDSNGNQIKLSSYISVIPTDPTTKASYDYVTNGSGTNPPTNYVLHTLLENQNATSQQNSYSNPVFSSFGVSASWKSSGSNNTGKCYDSSSYILDYCISTK